MDCALWLNRRKIFSADEISAYFDIAAIRGYFLGGSLCTWLAEHGGEMYIDALSALDPADPCLNDRLTEIFTQKKNTVPVHRADEQLINAVDHFRNGEAPAAISETCSYNGSFNSNSTAGSSFANAMGFGSFKYGSFGFNFGSFANKYGSFRNVLNYSSFGYGSYNYGSFSRSSFRLWEWEWDWRWYLGSFRSGSFRYGSFSGVAGAGSYRLGSFNYGSFAHGSFNYRQFGQGSFGFGFSQWQGFGSHRGTAFSGTSGSYPMLSSDEYDEIMYRTLGICPLDRFGYGIHLI